MAGPIRRNRGAAVVARALPLGADMRRLVPLLLLLVPACHDAAQLADLPGLEVSVRVWGADSDLPGQLGSVYLNFDGDAYRAAHDGDCPALGDVQVVFDGVATERVDPPYDGGPCLATRFELAADIPTDRPLVVTVVDESLSVRAELDSAPLVGRSATLRSPGDWTLTGGEEVVVGWSHPDDLATIGAVAYFLQGSAGFMIEDLTLTGDEIRFSIPPSPAVTGAGKLHFSAGFLEGDATACANAAACTWTTVHSYDQSVVIQP